ncbi:hypothetical protein AB6A40_009766 [Gnathostoma spinigerum]|uniref:Uncharacterized protein n=1 Tax=Gnathostoma spinigerum TaxID=75299 RepID=A0ABD6F189_9BILA
MGEEAKTPKILNEIAPLIQHDWFESARDPHSEGKFFVGIRRPGEKSKFTDVVQSKDGTFSTMAPEEVSVERMEGV